MVTVTYENSESSYALSVLITPADTNLQKSIVKYKGQFDAHRCTQMIGMIARISVKIRAPAFK